MDIVKDNTLKITTDMLLYISKIDEFKGLWRSFENLSPERLQSLRRVATIESIGSSTRIEGSKLSDKEVMTLLSNLEIKNFETRDEQEVISYAEVMDIIYLSWEEIKITENHIKQLHRDLLKHSDKDEWHRGNYKTSPNNVAAFDDDGNQIGIIFETASPFETGARMKQLIKWFNSAQREGKYHPLLLIGIFIVVLLEIHPFQDGNGRLSRILTTLLLLQAGYVYVPYASLESIIERSKEAYYLALRQTQGNIRTDDQDWIPWLEFFLKSLSKQTDHLKVKMEKEKILLQKIPELSLQILEHVKAHGRITTAEAVNITGANRNTIKLHLKNLVKGGHLKLNGSGRSSWYG